jgi:hypothetical protein
MHGSNCDVAIAAVGLSFPLNRRTDGPRSLMSISPAVFPFALYNSIQ